jgi:hypothetical protein
MGFVKQSKDFADYYVRSSAEGNYGVQCKIDARYDISLNLRFGLRFEAVSRAMQIISDEIYRRGRCGVRLDAKTEAYYRSIAPDFECFYERLVGLSDWTADTIEQEAELDLLCERTLQHVHEHGLPFFSKYSTLAAVARVVENDGPNWRHLAITRGDFLVTGAATMLVVHGRKGMVEYLKKHDADPDLGGWDRERTEMLVAVTEGERQIP